MLRLLDKIINIFAVVAGLLLLFSTLSVAYSIFTRSLNLPSPVWIVQFNEYTLLWITFLGTTWVLAKNRHAVIQLFTDRLSKSGQTRMHLLHNLTGMVLCGVLCWFGAMTTWNHFIRKVIDVNSVDFPKAIVLMVIPAGFLLLTFQFLRNFLGNLGTLKQKRTQKSE